MLYRYHNVRRKWFKEMTCSGRKWFKEMTRSGRKWFKEMTRSGRKWFKEMTRSITGLWEYFNSDGVRGLTGDIPRKHLN